MSPSRASLARQILAALADPSIPLDPLFVAVHRYQHALDPVLRALAPEPADDPARIPAVPVALYRDVAVGTVRPDEPHVAFHTSGTTGDRPGVHRVRDTTLYDAGCRLHAARWLPRGTAQTLALMADAAPSSLAHMVRGFADRTGPVRFLADDHGLHLDALDEVDRPTFVCATAFALDAWLARRPDPLPDGSWIFVTGGFKGHATQLDAEQLLAAAQAVAPVVLEYGMTELSSQLWAWPSQPYAPPRWMRVSAVDPQTGDPLPPDTEGQLRFLDLCNLDSTLHVETLDRGVVHADGRVHLLGRLEGAPARGCSLAIEELL